MRKIQYISYPQGICNVLAWPKSVFEFFHNILWNNLDEHFGQPSNWIPSKHPLPCLYDLTPVLSSFCILHSISLEFPSVLPVFIIVPFQVLISDTPACPWLTSMHPLGFRLSVDSSQKFPWTIPP